MTHSRTRMESSHGRATPAANGRRVPRRAFTLMEVLLTMTLMVIIASLAWVSLQRPLMRQRLHTAADAVRTQWCQARVDAMKSGHTYAFRYLLHGDRYHFGPQEDAAVADSSATPPVSTPDEGELGDEPLPPPVEKTLPQGIYFLGPGMGGEVAGTGDEPQTESADDGSGWSDPIYFYADGSTSDARLLVAADRRCVMRLLLRGLTGAVTVNDVTTMTQ